MTGDFTIKEIRCGEKEKQLGYRRLFVSEPHYFMGISVSYLPGVVSAFEIVIDVKDHTARNILHADTIANGQDSV